MAGHTLRAWTGVATDEGVGLITMVEVTDQRGVPLCSFVEFLGDAVRRADSRWPRTETAAAEALQARAMDRARDALLGGSMAECNGHRFDVQAGAG